MDGGRAAQERELVALLDAEPRWRRGRLRHVVAARETIIELFDMLHGRSAGAGSARLTCRAGRRRRP